ncbi:MAG: hypothetical protein ACKOOI_19070, partial [Pirellula sp.]
RNRFVTAVVERYVANILRDKSADTRDHCRIRSLTVRIDLGEEGHTELSELIGEAEQDARLGRRRRSEQELYELVSDMKALIDKLPADWQRLLELRNQMTMAEIATLMNVPRTTLNEWMKRIRDRFEEEGFQKYLDY